MVVKSSWNASNFLNSRNAKMALKTKQYSIHVKQCWQKLRQRIGTSYDLVEVIPDVQPGYLYLLCTLHGNDYDEAPENQKCSFVVEKAKFLLWMVDQALVIYNRRQKKLKQFKPAMTGKFITVHCYE